MLELLINSGEGAVDAVVNLTTATLVVRPSLPGVVNLATATVVVLPARPGVVNLMTATIVIKDTNNGN